MQAKKLIFFHELMQLILINFLNALINVNKTKKAKSSKDKKTSRESMN